MVNVTKCKGLLSLFIPLIYSYKRNILVKQLNCIFGRIWIWLYRYKQHLARLVKEALSLEKTPSTEMGETPEVVPEIVEEEKVASEVHLVQSVPIVIGADSPAKPQQKSTLVMDIPSSVS